MKIRVCDSVTWCYPDIPVTDEISEARVDIPRNGDDVFQIATDLSVPDGGSDVAWSCDAPQGLKVTLYQLCPVGVKFNSSPKHHETRDYESVKDFVTRRAPFEVFDRIRSLGGGKLTSGNLAFCVRVDAAKDAVPGEYSFTLDFTAGEESGRVNITAHVYRTALSDPEDSPYAMVHWLFNAGETGSLNICRVHNVEMFSEEYYYWVERHLEDLRDMRNNYFQLPTAIPVKDEYGRVVSFDFSQVARHARLALEHGFRTVYGGFIAHFRHWDEIPYFFLWNMYENVFSAEGDRQLRLYFDGVKQFIAANGLEGSYMQGLVDEPQVPNSETYKALCARVRELLPGVEIVDPIETPDIEGACDVYCVKQAVYHKYMAQFDEQIARGARYWFYSCGFPAGKWMNHVLDLPLSATRLCIWMGVKYRMDGFLHWGYMDYTDKMDFIYDTNLPLKYKGEMRYFPAGNAAMVYGSERALYTCLRAANQRLSAAEGELFMKLRDADPGLCDSLIASCCTDFETYTSDSAKILSVRRRLLEELDKR